MIYNIQAPQSIHTSIRLPASKSISNRVLLLNALSGSSYQLPVSSYRLPVPGYRLPVITGAIHNLSDSDDTQVLQKALLSSGADFDIGAAGTSMRFLTAYLAQRPGNWTITGTERMKNRPIKLLVEALRSLGAEIDYLEKDGFPPLRITGKTLKGGQITMNGGVSSQYISALMMIAPHLEQGLELRLTGDLISMPYLQLTTRLMQQFGVAVDWNGQTVKIQPQPYKPVPFTVESDWSAASYWYEIAALAQGNAQIALLGLEEKSMQGDAQGRYLFEKVGVSTRHCVAGSDPQSPDNQTTIIRGLRVPESSSGQARLRRPAMTNPTDAPTPLQHDFVNEPDLAQTFVVTCCLLGISFNFTGLQSLRIKETDRIAALQTELRKLGYDVSAKDNAMHWSGERCEPETHPVIATYEDHRMAMAFAPACLVNQNIRIADPHVVTKSYPNYWQDLAQAGFTITEE
ncbi:MAG: 3-phosphoshikimate 1-carboxyvinyltransferase [Candidatus Symbiothrix sp.]|jgi:3-phosphoshikimate 1-carboxyvinyltransferase|nr:3-phosphoshikimate 1-carboxyvinyltransferase [Candidatus Symbiothrix sp.]